MYAFRTPPRPITCNHSLAFLFAEANAPKHQPGECLQCVPGSGKLVGHLGRHLGMACLPWKKFALTSPTVGISADATRSRSKALERKSDPVVDGDGDGDGDQDSSGLGAMDQEPLGDEGFAEFSSKTKIEGLCWWRFGRCGKTDAHYTLPKQVPSQLII